MRPIISNIRSLLAQININESDLIKELTSTLSIFLIKNLLVKSYDTFTMHKQGESYFFCINEELVSYEEIINNRQLIHKCNFIINGLIRQISSNKILSTKEALLNTIIVAKFRNSLFNTIVFDCEGLDCCIKRDGHTTSDQFIFNQEVKMLVESVEINPRNKNIRLICTRSGTNFIRKLVCSMMPTLILNGIDEPDLQVVRFDGYKSIITIKSDAQVDMNSLLGYKQEYLKSLIDELAGEKIVFLKQESSTAEVIQSLIGKNVSFKLKELDDEIIIYCHEALAAKFIGKKGLNAKLINYVLHKKITICTDQNE